MKRSNVPATFEATIIQTIIKATEGIAKPLWLRKIG
jgi:hypothetical protein